MHLFNEQTDRQTDMHTHASVVPCLLLDYLIRARIFEKFSCLCAFSPSLLSESTETPLLSLPLSPSTLLLPYFCDIITFV